jgi:hypothetical protein
MDDDRTPHRRFRVRIKTLLVLVAFIALLVVVVIQQVQIARLERANQELADIYRVWRDVIERNATIQARAMSPPTKPRQPPKRMQQP